jgi:LmbE family N-acetylglucosaminyl deacetylase
VRQGQISFQLMRIRFRLPRIAVVGTALFVSAIPVSAQLEPPSTGGIVALQQELRMLGHNKRVLMIGAHPDDEDTELLTLLVRGMGAEAAYLSLNRGEGGQNLIGPELGEALGLIRTEELLAARRLDGARQYFTRAYDFGFSKSLEETWRFWPRDSVLKDVVRIVREFQPQIIVSIFSGTPRDGHGQHQAAGWAAREVFKIAEDSTRFPDVGDPWRPLKLYRSTRFDSAATNLRLNAGILDESVGQSYRQIAMRGRSLHRSQDMGQLQRIGPSEVRLQLIEDRTGSNIKDLWSGIDTTFSGALHSDSSSGTSGPSRVVSFPFDSLGRTDIADRGKLDTILERYGTALSERSPRQCWFHRFDTVCHSPSPNGAPWIDQYSHVNAARAIASGMVLDVTSDDERVVPGQTLRLMATVWNASDQPSRVSGGFRVFRIENGFPVPEYHWDTNDADSLRAIGPGALDTFLLSFQIPENTPYTQPYFLTRARAVAMYDWPIVRREIPGLTDSFQIGRGVPFERPELEFRLDLSLAGQGPAKGISFEREVTFRVNDQAFGERRRPVVIVPRVDVKVDPGTEIWSTSPSPHEFTVTLTHGAKDSTRGNVTLEVPAGWPAVASRKFEFTREDEREGFRFSLRAPANLRPGKYEVRAVATDDQGRRYDQGVFTVDYPHIRPRSWTQRSTATINVAPLELARLKRIGYIRGASDRVPEALESVRLPIELLDQSALERGDLSGFDAIIVGSRAYETDPALVENNARLLAYARNGGLLIVQYQQQVFFNGNFAPFPLKVGGEQIVLDSAGRTRVGPLIGHDRVTDETAPVRIIDPRSAVVNRPNRIGPADWEGWVQERGLYFARSWDEAYQPVLEMADPGEAPLRGGLLVAKYGQGTYVYTGISFFRELPAGVPGAFRLFANLLALAESSVP